MILFLDCDFARQFVLIKVILESKSDPGFEVVDFYQQIHTRYHKQFRAHFNFYNTNEGKGSIMIEILNFDQ